MNPQRINYECLGNQLAHVHWHVIPRYAAPIDPDPTETVWVRPANERNAGVTPERAAALIERVRHALLFPPGLVMPHKPDTRF
jgi:diadenosine tetraphosphate (Ap4A) HIT family hydrolase